MRTLEELYEDAKMKNIEVCNFKLKELNAMCYKNGSEYIAIDYKKANNATSVKMCLAHELGHCEYGTFYGFADIGLQSHEKAERQANFAMAKMLMSPDELMKAFESGYTELHQLAEFFDVDEDYIAKFVEIYKQKELI